MGEIDDVVLVEQWVFRDLASSMFTVGTRRSAGRLRCRPRTALQSCSIVLSLVNVRVIQGYNRRRTQFSSMADSGIGSWTDGLSARERVREIGTTLTEPRSVEWVREQAQISSWQTAKDELEMLVEFGQVQAVEGDDGNTKYAPNYQLRYINEVVEMINTHTRAELREEIASIQSEIDEWKQEFSVESREQLESTLADDDLDSEAIRERNTILRQWDRYEDNKRLLSHALELYDDTCELYPGQNDSSNSSLSLSQ